MAVKFSEFTPIQDASNPDDLTQIVGFATVTSGTCVATFFIYFHNLKNRTTQSIRPLRLLTAEFIGI